MGSTMKIFKNICILILVLCLPPFVHAQQRAVQPEITVDPAVPGPGDLMVVSVKNEAGPVKGTFNGKKIYFNPSNGSFKAIVAIDYFTEPGTYDLDIAMKGVVRKETVEVVKKEYEVQHLTLPRNMVELSPRDEARAEREQRRLAAIWPKETHRSWKGDFINPLNGDIITPFGVRRLINDIPKSPHTGVDVRGKEGEKIIAPNNAVVALIDNQFFSGKSLVLNHGQGIYTMFFHLSKVLVKRGQVVKKGQAIALVGETGRATGPHLHWGVRIQGARVDPLELLHLDLE
jgi:murein DD-endopeptidase MepM/ murein hydrolase activator NlpD